MTNPTVAPFVTNPTDMSQICHYPTKNSFVAEYLRIGHLIVTNPTVIFWYQWDKNYVHQLRIRRFLQGKPSWLAMNIQDGAPGNER